MRRQMVRPRPVPTPIGLVVKKGSKMRSCTSAEIPGPLSSTVKSIQSPECVARTVTSPSRGPSSRSAWAAFTKRLRRTWPRRASFACTGGRSSRTSTRTSARCERSEATMASAESTTGRSATGSVTSSEGWESMRGARAPRRALAPRLRGHRRPAWRAPLWKPQGVRSRRAVCGAHWRWRARRPAGC